MHINESGDRLRGLTIFNVPVGEDKYVQTKLRDKAKQVQINTEAYVKDLGEEYSQELWTMLQLSLPHRITYWLRTCTPEETMEMASHVDCCIMEAVHAATRVNFETEMMAKERLRLPARMKEGALRERQTLGARR